ncbi:MAG: hypothetical protein ABL994_14910, partial [Verrucomicrobiales bacterium]
MIGGSEIGFGSGEFSIEESELLHFFPPLRPGRLPAFGVGIRVEGDVPGQGMERKVRSGKGEVVEKRSTGVIRRVILQHFDDMIGEGGRAVVVCALLHRRKGKVVFKVFVR